MIPIALKKIGKTILTIGRGLFKGSLPGVAGVIEAIKNRKGVEMTVKTPGGEMVTGIAKPHDPWSYVPGMIVGAIIFYGLYTKKFEPSEVIDIAKQLVEILGALAGR